MRVEIIYIFFDIHLLHDGSEWKIADVPFRGTVGYLSGIFVCIHLAQSVHLFLEIYDRIIYIAPGLPEFNELEQFIGTMSSAMLGGNNNFRRLRNKYGLLDRPV